MEDFFKNKWVAYIALAIISVTGVADLNMAVNPGARPDSCTGTRCGAHESRTAELEEWAHIVELRLQAIESRGEECKEHIDELRKAINSHLEVSKRKILEYNVKLKEHDIKINECFRRMP